MIISVSFSPSPSDFPSIPYPLLHVLVFLTLLTPSSISQTPLHTTFCFVPHSSMEPQQQQQANDGDQDQGGGSSGGKLASNYLCRQSSTRWTPTSDQIKILKDLYYNNGVRSPTADQVQKISARLRQYGKIEGKNVFYWFQNHKARERQNVKKKIAGIACPPSAAGVVSTGCGYGHMSMESNFKECAISACAGNGICTFPNQSFQWAAGVNPYFHQPYPFMEYTINRSSADHHETQFQDEEDQEYHQYENETPTGELETLPLFPINARDDDDQPPAASSFCGTMTTMMVRPEPVNCYSATASNCYTTVSTTTSLEVSAAMETSDLTL